MWTSFETLITGLLGERTLGELGFWERVLYILGKYSPSFLEGAGSTLIVALIGTVAGCLIGFVVGILQTIPVSKRDNLPIRGLVGALKAVLRGYVELFRGTPMMLQAMVFFYGAPQVLGIQLGVWETALWVVSINTGAYMAETVRGGILSIDPGQTEGAKAIGMNHVQTMVHVILPQTLRNILPQIGNNLIINVKDTCVLSVIGFTELFFRYRSVAGSLYVYFEAAVIVLVMYLIMTVVLSRLLRLFERKMEGNDNYDLATTDTLAHTTGLYSYPGKGSNFDERHKEGGDGSE